MASNQIALKTVIIVDDAEFMCELIKTHLCRNNFDVIGIATTGYAAIKMICELNPELITLDIMLPDIDGVSVLKSLKKQNIKSRIIIVSAVGQKDTIKECMNLGADAYITKPFVQKELIDTIIKILN